MEAFCKKAFLVADENYVYFQIVGFVSAHCGATYEMQSSQLLVGQDSKFHWRALENVNIKMLIFPQEKSEILQNLWGCVCFSDWGN